MINDIVLSYDETVSKDVVLNYEGYLRNYKEIIPRKEKLCVVLHGFELPQHDYKNDLDYYFPTTPGEVGYKSGNKGVMARPCATRLKEFRPTEMTKKLQEMHFGVLKETVGNSMSVDEVKRAFTSIWANGREYNDHGASEGNNFINKPNGDPPGFKMNPIVGDGAILEIVGNITSRGYTIVNGKKKYSGLGENCWPVRMLNAMSMDYTSTPLKHPWLWHKANIARRDGRIIPYGQLGGYDVWMPNLRPDNDVNWIPCDLVRVLSQTENLPDCYYP